MTTGVNTSALDLELSPIDRADRFLEHGIEFGPHRALGRFPPYRFVIQDPTFVIVTPGNDRDLYAVTLHVDASGYHQGRLGTAQEIEGLASFQELIPGELVSAVMVPGFAQAGVDKDLEELGRRLGFEKIPRHVRPGSPG